MDFNLCIRHIRKLLCYRNASILVHIVQLQQLCLSRDLQYLMRSHADTFTLYRHYATIDAEMFPLCLNFNSIIYDSIQFAHKHQAHSATFFYHKQRILSFCMRGKSNSPDTILCRFFQIFILKLIQKLTVNN